MITTTADEPKAVVGVKSVGGVNFAFYRITPPTLLSRQINYRAKRRTRSRQS